MFEKEFKLQHRIQYSGSGLCGALYMKGPGVEMIKCHIELFSCCITRALHLELVQKVSATTYVNCLKCPCARRGKLSLVISDNAKILKVTVKLKNRLGNEEAVVEFLNSRKINC